MRTKNTGPTWPGTVTSTGTFQYESPSHSSGEPQHNLEDDCFHNLYPTSHSLSHYQQLVAVGEWVFQQKTIVNQQLCFQVQVSLNHASLLQYLNNICQQYLPIFCPLLPSLVIYMNYSKLCSFPTVNHEVRLGSAKCSSSCFAFGCTLPQYKLKVIVQWRTTLSEEQHHSKIQRLRLPKPVPYYILSTLAYAVQKRMNKSPGEVTYCPILYNPQTPPTSPRKTCRKFCKHPCTLKYPQERSGVPWPRRKPHCSSRIWGWSQRWSLLSSSLHFPRKPSVISLNLKYTSKSQFKDRGTPTPVWRAQSATSMQCCRCMSTQEHPEL